MAIPTYKDKMAAKSLLLFLLFLWVTPFVSAGDFYTHKIYTSVTLLYWCTYKEVPVSKVQIAKVARVDSSNPKYTIDLDKWLSTLSYEINGEVLTIIRESNVITNGKIQRSVTSSSSTKCDPRKMVEYDPNEEVETDPDFEEILD